jgi:hypothetical protein
MTLLVNKDVIEVEIVFRATLDAASLVPLPDLNFHSTRNYPVMLEVYGNGSRCRL